MADMSPQKNQQVQMTETILRKHSFDLYFKFVPSANMAVEELLSYTAASRKCCSNFWGALMSAIFSSSQAS